MGEENVLACREIRLAINALESIVQADKIRARNDRVRAEEPQITLTSAMSIVSGWNVSESESRDKLRACEYLAIDDGLVNLVGQFNESLENYFAKRTKPTG